MKPKTFIGLLFLCLQIFGVFYARFIPERFFCWGPYDHHTEFKISVVIDGDSLSSEEIQKRYRYNSEGYERRHIANIFMIVSDYESTYGRADSARVHIQYASNGNPPQAWTFKP